MNFESIAALVPMRHHSQRVQGKNYRELAGKPLFHHILDTLKKVPEIANIAVDTDSDVIMEGISENFPNVEIIIRPAELRPDIVPMNEILIHDISQIKADLYLQTHSTNPLLNPSTISDAINYFRKNADRFDSLFSVTRMQTRLWDEEGNPINHNPEELLQTQDLPPVFEENSCLYLFTKSKLLEKRHRLGDKPLMFEIPRGEALDIDEEIDFLIANLLMRHRLET